MEQSKDNPFFYVQYASASDCHSVFRQAKEQLPGDLAVDRATLMSRLRKARRFGRDRADPQARRISARDRSVRREAHEPHRLAFYLYDLASSFHAHWNRGTDQIRLTFC